jgi:hypothetical protein
MTPKLTEEQRKALHQSPGRPVRVEDEQTHKTYLLVGEDALGSLWEDYIHREVQKGLEAADRGEVEPWEIESLKAEGRRILEDGPSQP